MVENIHTEHRTDENGEQITTKRVEHDGETYELVGDPGGIYEHIGDGAVPQAVADALREHVGADEAVEADVGQASSESATAPAPEAGEGGE